jgi:hypothetical protein
MAASKETAVWQVGGGPTQRSYVDQLIEFGVALIGPGDAGEWNSGLSDDDFGGSGVRRFATEPGLGDIVLLRSGQSIIHASWSDSIPIPVSPAVRRRQWLGLAARKAGAVIPPACPLRFRSWSFRSEPKTLWADQCRFGYWVRAQFHPIAADGLADRGAAVGAGS